MKLCGVMGEGAGRALRQAQGPPNYTAAMACTELVEVLASLRCVKAHEVRKFAADTRSSSTRIEKIPNNSFIS